MDDFVHPCFWVLLLFLETGGCDAVKAQTSADADGEYFMQIGTDCDTRVRLYCRGMRTDNPTEYISLLSGPKDNYAYVYGYKQPYASREECVKADGKFVFAFCAAVVTFYWPLGGFERMLRKLDRTSALKRGRVRHNYNLVSLANSKCVIKIVIIVKMCFLSSFNLYLYHSCKIIYQGRQSRKGD